MTSFNEFKEVIQALGVLVHGLPANGVQCNTDQFLEGTCVLLDPEAGVRCKAEALPAEICGRVTEYWGVRSTDGAVEVFVLKLKRRIHVVDSFTTPQTEKPSLLSLLIQEGSNLVVMYDKILRVGCVCAAFTGSRISGERFDFVRPKPFNDYDPYGESVVEKVEVCDDIADMLKKMREMALAGQAAGGGGEVEPEAAGESAGGDPDSGILSEDEIERLLKGGEDQSKEPEGGGQEPEKSEPDSGGKKKGF